MIKYIFLLIIIFISCSYSQTICNDTIIGDCCPPADVLDINNVFVCLSNPNGTFGVGCLNFSVRHALIGVITTYTYRVGFITNAWFVGSAAVYFLFIMVWETFLNMPEGISFRTLVLFIVIFQGIFAIINDFILKKSRILKFTMGSDLSIEFYYMHYNIKTMKTVHGMVMRDEIPCCWGKSWAGYLLLNIPPLAFLFFFFTSQPWLLIVIGIGYVVLVGPIAFVIFDDDLLKYCYALMSIFPGFQLIGIGIFFQFVDNYWVGFLVGYLVGTIVAYLILGAFAYNYGMGRMKDMKEKAEREEKRRILGGETDNPGNPSNDEEGMKREKSNNNGNLLSQHM